MARQLKDQDWIVFCEYGYTRRTSTDGRTCYVGHHTATGKTCGGRTREATERKLVKIQENELKIKESIAFLREQGYFISKPVY